MGMSVSKKFYLLMIAVTVIAAAVSTYVVMRNREKPEAVRAAIELVEVDSYWTEKAVLADEVTLVPAFTFRIHNKRQTPLGYVQANGIFTISGEKEALGDSFAYPIQGEALAPGATSAPVVLKSNYGYKASSKQAFLHNPGFKPVEVRLFVQSRSSGPVLLGTFRISKKIEGMPQDVQETQNALTLK